MPTFDKNEVTLLFESKIAYGVDNVNGRRSQPSLGQYRFKSCSSPLLFKIMNVMMFT